MCTGLSGRKTEAVFQWKRALSFGPEEDEDADRIRRKLDVGLDVVLADETGIEKPSHSIQLTRHRARFA